MEFEGEAWERSVDGRGKWRGKRGSVGGGGEGGGGGLRVHLNQQRWAIRPPSSLLHLSHPPSIPPSIPHPPPHRASVNITMETEVTHRGGKREEGRCRRIRNTTTKRKGEQEKGKNGKRRVKEERRKD